MLLIYNQEGQPFPCDVLVLGEKLRCIDLGNAAYKIVVSADVTEKDKTVTVEKPITRTVTREKEVSRYGQQHTVSNSFDRSIDKRITVTKWLGTMTVHKVNGQQHIRVVTKEKYV